VSAGAEMSKRNIKLWNLYTTIILYYQQCAVNILFTPVLQEIGPLRKFLFSSFSIEKRLSFSLLALNYDKFSHRL